MNKLYCIRIPGPDDVYAAPSRKVAELMKKESDATTRELLAEMHAKGVMLYLSLDNCLAVIEEIEDPQEHAELLEEFKFEDWGITEADLVDEDSPQINMFDGAEK